MHSRIVKTTDTLRCAIALSAKRARDVRAADLQEKPTKGVKNKVGSPETVVSLDPTKTAATQRTSQRAERAIKHSEHSERSNQIVQLWIAL
jgi:hypothetical protein